MIRMEGRSKLCHLQEGEVPYLTFVPLEGIPFLRHGFSTRRGGVSEGIFATMNLAMKPPVGCVGEDAKGYENGEEIARVRENFRRIGEAMKMPIETMVHGKQTHTANVRVVTEEDRGKGILREADYSDIDGLVTNVPGITLVTGHADCIPLYFVDPKKKAIGLSHAGWKGTILNIAAETVRLMKENYGTDPADLLVVAGPGICGKCYEVDGEVADRFMAAYGEESLSSENEAVREGLSQLLGSPNARVIRRKENGKYALDLHAANACNLLKAGIPAEQIYLSDVCTRDNADLLFSHRATGGRRGGGCAFLALTDM